MDTTARKPNVKLLKTSLQVFKDVPSGLSQPYGMGATIGSWTRLVESSVEQQKEMLGSIEYRRLRQAAFLGLQYHCFNCYAVCPIGRQATARWPARQQDTGP